MSYVITFGKHKGTTWLDLIKAGNTKYFEWCLDKLDVAQFTGPSDEAIYKYLEQFDSDAQSTALVKRYRARVASTEEQFKAAEDKNLPVIVLTPEEKDNVIRLFEDHCLELFGSFPFKGYQNG